MKHRSLSLLAATLLVAGATFFGTPAFAADDASVIHVTGQAQQEVAPDTAYLTIGMESTSTDADAARSENNTTMTNIRNAMESMGIPKENLRTTNFYMSPNYDSKSRKIVSYTVTNSLQVKVTDFDMIPRIIAKAGTLNANKIQNLRFTTEHADQIRANLIKEAIRNGRQAAEAAALAAGSQLGKVKEININGTSPSYEVARYSGVSLMRATAKAADFAPIEAGTNTLNETVDLTFYLQ